MDSTFFSRPLATAASLGDFAPDRHLFTKKQVLLTGEPAILLTANGRQCLLNSMRLVVRFCSNVAVSVPRECERLGEESRALADCIKFAHAFDFQDSESRLDTFDAILAVGSKARPELPWTVINSNGWLARISSGKTHIDARCEQDNPISALAAASLGTGEIFKRLIALKPERGALLDGLSFSLFSYTQSSDPGPALPAKLPMGFMLVVGVGAIGNGNIHLLSRLPIQGKVFIVDPQKFRRENLGTCLLTGPQDLDRSKAEFAARILERVIETRPFAEEFAAFRERLGTQVPHPDFVLTGLDNIDARHEVQDLWPDQIIDGAIGDFGCQVSCHPWGPDVACVKCLFRKPAGESAESVAIRVTGLTGVRAKQMLETVSEDDVRNARKDKQEWLKAHIGVQICSVIEQGVAQELSSEKLRNGFAPSVPFVACFSASMQVGELVKSVTGVPTPLAPRFQFDFLRGPGFGDLFPQSRRATCVCVTRRRNIEATREKRAR
jgi:molybdopterin/thiamine biosynthesis adenylyltransferase